MTLFARQFEAIQQFKKNMQKVSKVREYTVDDNLDWPTGGKRNIVLTNDMAVELGNPKNESISFLMWQEAKGIINDNRISIIGPDVSEYQSTQLPFGKVVLIGGEGFQEENYYERYREMENVRYDIDLMGYMMRGVSQYQREWSRISKQAILQGFSLKILGQALIEKLKKIPYITEVEILFVTSSKKDVLNLKEIGQKTHRIISAMNKMAEELSFDCDTCEYTDVCQDVAELRSMREKMQNRAKKYA